MVIKRKEDNIIDGQCHQYNHTIDSEVGECIVGDDSSDKVRKSLASHFGYRVDVNDCDLPSTQMMV